MTPTTGASVGSRNVRGPSTSTSDPGSAAAPAASPASAARICCWRRQSGRSGSVPGSVAGSNDKRLGPTRTSTAGGMTPPARMTERNTRCSPNEARPSARTEPTAYAPKSPGTRRPSSEPRTRSSTRRTPSTNHTGHGDATAGARAADHSFVSTKASTRAAGSSSLARSNPMPYSGVQGSARRETIGAQHTVSHRHDPASSPQSAVEGWRREASSGGAWTLKPGLTVVLARPKLSPLVALGLRASDPRGRVENATAPADAAPKVSWVRFLFRIRPPLEQSRDVAGFLTHRGVWSHPDRGTNQHVRGPATEPVRQQRGR